MKVKTVVSHHHVLPYWAEIRKKMGAAPYLITFDHHTDTAFPFRSFLKKHPELNESDLLGAINFNDDQSVVAALPKLKNDEHIITAIRTGIIRGACVVAHNAANTGIHIYQEHKVFCRSVQYLPESTTEYDNDSVIEDHFLSKKMSEFESLLKEVKEPTLEETGFILDIDLDYFNTHASVRPKSSAVIKNLYNSCKLLTIATEPEYVLSCATEPGLTSDYLLKELKSLIVN